MLYVKNIPLWERLLRVVIGALLVGLGLAASNEMLMWIMLGSAAASVLSGLFGFCPACAMVGRRLEKK